MDYVDGESLDRPLKRGERFSQPQVIQWAIQLLQALEYLHSPTHGTPPRGYVHSDVKPANLMRRANGDICLIDFNISLALGEDSVIGASAGYASPEHYGLDYSFSGDTATMKQETQTMDDRTATMTMPGIRRKIRPDVRSDIYSTGATLYHLLSGRRPAKDALEVAPLSEMEVSPQIARMIAKAMAPNPQDRYQTASEMLWELEHLRENDIRTIRHKRRVKTTAAALAVTFLLGRTKLGVDIRATGFHAEAAESVGIKTGRVKTAALVFCGVFCGLGGAYLSMASLGYFSAGMVSGRGFIGIAAEAMGMGIPWLCMAFSFLFGAVDYFAVGSQTVLSAPYELLNTLPYVMTMAALAIYAAAAKNRAGRQKE